MALDPSLTLLYDFVRQQNLRPLFGLGPELGFVRPDPARYFDSDGILRTALPGEARFDHNPVSLVPLGLLVEEARINIVIQNENLAVSWTNQRTVDAQNAGVAPDGANTLNKITDNLMGGENTAAIFQSPITIATSTVFTVSVYAKKDQLDWLFLEVGALAALAINAYFDLTNGIVGATVGADVTSTFIEDIGNGIYKCGFIFTSDAADNAGNVFMGIAEGDNDRTITMDGSSSIFAWGVGLEAGAFPLSYIGPTLASSVTRNADVVSTTDMSWLNAVAGTYYADVRTGNISNDTTVFSIHDGTADERIAVEITGGDIHFIGVDGGGAPQWDISTAVAADTPYKIAVAWAANDVAFYLNGSQVGVDSGATLPTVTQLNIGSDHADAEFFNSTHNEDRYYTVRKANQFLEDLSKGLISYGFPANIVRGSQRIPAAMLADEAKMGGRFRGIMSGQ